MMDSQCVWPRTKKEISVGKLNSLPAAVATVALGVRAAARAAGTTKPGVQDKLSGLKPKCLLSDPSTFLVLPHEAPLLCAYRNLE